MMNQQDIDELTEVFVEESMEIVENLNKDVLELEKCVGNAEVNRDLVNNIFRYVHTLKGNSGLAGADKLRDLAHKLESLLDRLRKEKMALTPVMVDVLFAGIDRIGAILQEVISNSDHGVVIDDLIIKLDALLAGKQPEEDAKAAPPAAVKPAEPHAPAEPKQVKKEISAPPHPVAHAEESSLTAIPEDVRRVLTEYEESRLLESIAHKCNIYQVVLNLAMEGFEQVVAAVIEKLNSSGEVIAKVPSSKRIQGYDLQVRVIFASPSVEKDVNLALKAVKRLENFSLKELISQEAPIEAKAEPVQVRPAEAKPALEPPRQPAKPEPPRAREVAPAPTPAPAPKPEPAPPVQAAPAPVVRPKKPSEAPAKPTAPAAPAAKDTSGGGDQTGGNMVRVDIKKLDNLMNIVGELVLAKARYLQIEAELETLMGYKALRDTLKKNNKSTSKKLEDLREAILQVRMVQVGTLFNRFPRIVRDLAKEHEKQIQLVREGEETELDKAVIDEMGDPLIHLIRNSADHALEDPETRRQKGKPETGTITLRAYQEGSYIVIEIQDDGRGIDLNRIREKAIETGMIDRGAKLTDNELLNFIFHPGFSTAQKVTNTSGRGVGMDAVKETITRLKGIIDIHTELNVGTKVIVKLPLTLAIIQVLLIRVVNHIYAIPLASVTESFKLLPEKIEIIDGQEVTQLRDVVLPLLRLKEAFGLEDAPVTPPVAPSPESVNDDAQTQPRNFVVVVELADKRIGVIVDELLEQQEIVIKPLGRYLINTPGFAGATTLGNGRVVLILDIIGLIESLNVKYKASLKRHPEKPAAVAERSS